MCIEYVANVIIRTKARISECLHGLWNYLHFPLGPLKKTSSVRDSGRLLPVEMPGSAYNPAVVTLTNPENQVGY